eukprot:COSAG04_NODE_2703_length_3709_cov_7.614404_2_plen_70_part_00
MVDSSFGWPHPEPDEAHLDRLIVGQSYKHLLLLFYEECCSRGFEIVVEHITYISVSDTTTAGPGMPPGL